MGNRLHVSVDQDIRGARAACLRKAAKLKRLAASLNTPTDVLRTAEDDRCKSRQKYKAVVKEAHQRQWRRMLERAKAEGPHEVTRQIHKQYQRLASKGKADHMDCLQATLNYDSLSEKAVGETQSGELASKFVHAVSKFEPDNPAYSVPFREMQEEAVATLNADWADWQAMPAVMDAPTQAEVGEAVASLKGKKSKSPGLDGVTNWMLL